MRTNEWLESRLEHIYKQYFGDIEASNDVYIEFGRKAKNQLGCIKKVFPKGVLNRIKGDFDTKIIINGYFRDESIPEYVVDATIAHELSHYAHGFSSPLPQKYRHPHKGGKVKHEMHSRGFEETLKRQKRWIKENWRNYLKGK